MRTRSENGSKGQGFENKEQTARKGLGKLRTRSTPLERDERLFGDCWKGPLRKGTFACGSKHIWKYGIGQKEKVYNHPKETAVHPPPLNGIPASSWYYALIWRERVRETQLERKETTGQTELTDNDAVLVHGCRAWRAWKAYGAKSNECCNDMSRLVL